MGCVRCRKVQIDPAKGKSPWARIVVGGEQVLVCPDCQRDAPEVMLQADRCPACGSTRLAVVMGSIVCRGCGRDFERDGPAFP